MSRDLIYHLAVAAPVPAVLVILAFTKARGTTRIILVATALLLFVVLFYGSFIFFCECE